MLSVLSEKKEVQLPSDASQAVSGFIYLPPEVLHQTEDDPFFGWYRSMGDVYGLGLLIIELFFKQHDIFLEKKQVGVSASDEIEY